MESGAVGGRGAHACRIHRVKQNQAGDRRGCLMRLT